MTIEFFVWLGLALSAIPAFFFLWNLALYREPPVYAPGWLGKKRGDETNEIKKADTARISVLIPARDEARNIVDCLNSVLSNDGMDFEALVFDDQSSDNTSELVRQVAADSPRVRLVTGPPPPEGWCGKQHACHQLAQAASHPLLIFLDADVRLSRTALWRLAAMMDRGKADLASGIPRVITGTMLERMVAPLVHFDLLATRSLMLMRKFRSPAFSAGCGQLVAAKAESYRAAGGHAAIRSSLNDGEDLARAFRRAGLATDLFDATQIASSRRYSSAREAWDGLKRSAGASLSGPRSVFFATLLQLGSGPFPGVMLLLSLRDLSSPFLPALLAALLGALPRLLSTMAFQQSIRGTLMHPFGAVVMMVIQWQALLGRLLKSPVRWKGRTCPGAGPAER